MSKNTRLQKISQFGALFEKSKKIDFSPLGPPRGKN
jgi:hypothetical protein